MWAPVFGSSSGIVRLPVPFTCPQEQERSDLLEQYRHLSLEAERFETQANQLESEGSNLRLELMTLDSENHHLKERVQGLEREIQEVWTSCCLESSSSLMSFTWRISGPSHPICCSSSPSIVAAPPTVKTLLSPPVRNNNLSTLSLAARVWTSLSITRNDTSCIAVW